MDCVLSEDYICSHDFQCGFNTIHCLDDEPCNIECSANYACRHLTIICPRNSSCNLQCIGNTKQNQCESINITAIHSTMLIVNVSIQIMDDTNSNNNNSPKTMRNGNIYCPTHNTLNQNIPNCLINCDGDDLMRKTTIYAIDGFSDNLMINSNHYSSNWCYRSGQMQCGPNYSNLCSMNNNEPFQCIDTTNPCNPITTISPTIEPTMIPSMEPTLEPTLNVLNEINPFVSETTDINISNLFDEFSTTNYDKYTTIPMTTTKIINLDEMENWIQSNEFMTMIVVAGIMLMIICMAFCITCNKCIKERKIGDKNMEQIPGQMNQEIGEDESIEYQYDYNYNATQKNRFGNKWNVGEYDIVPSQPIYDYA